MIYLTPAQKIQIENEARKHYPHECCGILAGHIQSSGKQVLGVYPVTNTNKERSVDRYNIHPGEFLEVSKTIEETHQSIVGIYHTHPDHPDRPSEFDREHAWDIWSYIIVGIQKGAEVSMRSFVLDSDRQFQEEDIQVTR